MTLVNPMRDPQDVTVIYNVDARADALIRTYTVAGCGEVVISTHTDLGLPATTAYYRVVAYFPGPGFAQLVIRSLPTFETAAPILPPPVVIR